MFSNKIKQNLSKKYCCEKCEYTTDRKSNLENHNLSAKHIKSMISNEIKQKISTDHMCIFCNKKYKDYSGLWRHKKKCLEKEENKKDDTNISQYENTITPELVIEIIKQNQELQKQNNELQKQMLEVIKNGTNNTTNVNSHNKSFNLNLFLNETCKDAMNIMDFVNSIKIRLEDMESIGELGFVNGISKLIINNLKALDENMRPVHCSDQKREHLYVKDDNVWNKEDSDNKKMKKAIKYIAHKNICSLSLWKDKYPEYNNSDSKRSDQYNCITMEAMGGAGNNDEEKANKIVKKIAKSVLINKNT